MTSAKTSFAPAPAKVTPEALKKEDTRKQPENAEKPAIALLPRKVAWLKPAAPVVDDKPGVDNAPRTGSLAGRSMTVSSASQINLRDKEVILTFDDGPIPGRTEKVLSVLDRYNVHATFLMVGQMARNYATLARRVASEGHSVGSHTFDHANLQKKSHARAIDDIVSGDAAVRKATGSSVGFFRFPYLAGTKRLRQELAEAGIVVLDVDIDSKDYFASSPEVIAARTMAAVRAKGRGIILMHDIHTRTSSMLPALLSMLKSEGYSVVSLRYGRGGRTSLVSMGSDS